MKSCLRVGKILESPPTNKNQPGSCKSSLLAGVTIPSGWNVSNCPEACLADPPRLLKMSQNQGGLASVRPRNERFKAGDACGDLGLSHV